MNNNKDKPVLDKPSSVAESIGVITILIICIYIAVTLFKDNPTGGPIQLALTFTAFIGIILGFKKHVPWKKIEQSISESVGIANNGIGILFCVGARMGTWIIRGTVPSMIE